MIIHHQHEYDCNDSSSSPIIGDAKPIALPPAFSWASASGLSGLRAGRAKVLCIPGRRGRRWGQWHLRQMATAVCWWHQWHPITIWSKGNVQLSDKHRSKSKVHRIQCWIRYWMFVRFRSWEPWNMKHQKPSGPTWDPDILQSFDHSWWWWWPESRASPDNPKNSASVGYLYRLDTPKKLPGFKMTKLHKKTCPKTIQKLLIQKKVELYNHGKHTLNH